MSNIMMQARKTNMLAQDQAFLHQRRIPVVMHDSSAFNTTGKSSAAHASESMRISGMSPFKSKRDSETSMVESQDRLAT